LLIPHSWRLLRNLGVVALLIAPLVWFVYLILNPGPSQDYRLSGFQELVSWVNIALIPLLAILALTTYLSTGNRQAEALAVAALIFAAVFPMHRLFTALQNDITFRFYSTPARFLFVALFLALSGKTARTPVAQRRRKVILVILVPAILTVILRFGLKGSLEDLIATQGSNLALVRDAMELLTILLAGIAALRLVGVEPSGEVPAPARLAAAFVLTAEQSLFLLLSDPPDPFWWGANVLWVMATLLEIWAMFSTADVSRFPEGPVDSQRSLTIGSKLGSYVIVGWLGEGGMGQIFKARHRRLNREVAIKVIRPQQLANPETLQRFHREARATARLSHPNIVHVHDAAETDGMHYLVMEYVNGKDLGELVLDRGPLPPPLACEYIRQASLGLQHAHECGLIHRDIKPANLLLTEDGTQVKLLDLGVARFLVPDESDLSVNELTQTGAVMGTPAYLAPEQARDPRHADIRADIYSLGCTLYHLLIGQVPFPGVTLAEVVLQHQLEEPAPIDERRPGIPPELQVVLRKMMAKRPEDRYQVPAEVVDALAPFAKIDPDVLAAWMAANTPPSTAVEISTQPLDPIK
jgi:tRNA A-37 threonylcarbamoyl transferase component Bud32